jgi:alpha-L-arabinofuranosidase
MARIGIDLERRIGTIARRLFGQFIEHLGRCIYGGIYDEGSALADTHGFRKDVRERCVEVRGSRFDHTFPPALHHRPALRRRALIG